MNQNLNLFLAFSAGILSFLSPCVLPLIPSYLSLLGGASFEELSERKVSRLHILWNSLLFVAGFSGVFIVLGVLFSGTGGLFSPASRIINIVSGSLVILLGFNFIFDFWKLLDFERKVRLRRRPRGATGALLLGMAFGAGWTPCVGPILASILFLASSSGRVLQGVALLGLYSLGLGVPFLVAGLFFSQFLRQKERLKRHFRALKIASGVFLAFIGVLIVLGRLQRFNSFLFKTAGLLQSWQEASPWLVRLLFGLVFLAAALACGALYLAGLVRWLRHKEVSAQRQALRLAFGLGFLILAVLTLAGLVRPAVLLTFWLAYQGI